MLKSNHQKLTDTSEMPGWGLEAVLQKGDDADGKQGLGDAKRDVLSQAMLISIAEQPHHDQTPSSVSYLADSVCCVVQSSSFGVPYQPAHPH